jgi:hypothetical protein
MYKIIHAATMEDLERQVNDAMRDGWAPQGGVQFESSNYGLWIQAMVNYMTSPPWHPQDEHENQYEEVMG